jgi:hypothetical protein
MERRKKNYVALSGRKWWVLSICPMRCIWLKYIWLSAKNRAACNPIFYKQKNYAKRLHIK